MGNRSVMGFLLKKHGYNALLPHFGGFIENKKDIQCIKYLPASGNTEMEY
jgi:hypothetical protein